MMRHIVTAACLAGLLAGAVPARAQASDTGRLEISVGAAVTSGLTLSSGNASETTSSGGAFTLFSTSETIARAASGEMHLGFRLTRRLDAEGSVRFGKPQLRVAVTNDAENAAPITASERVEEATFSGGLVWYPGAFSDNSRVVPFVEAGAGYVRVLHEELTFVQAGRAYEAGAGAKFVLHRGGGVKRIGLRVDARALAREKGLFATRRVVPAVGASLFMRF
jgi:hypothetical protein